MATGRGFRAKGSGLGQRVGLVGGSLAKGFDLVQE